MENLFNNIDITKNYEHYSIIEFGGGDSSAKIYSLFNNVKNLQYYIVESNPQYLPENSDNKFKTIVYNEKDIEILDLHNVICENTKFDLYQ
jgi:hypothetical protein